MKTAKIIFMHDFEIVMKNGQQKDLRCERYTVGWVGVTFFNGNRIVHWLRKKAVDSVCLAIAAGDQEKNIQTKSQVFNEPVTV